MYHLILGIIVMIFSLYLENIIADFFKIISKQMGWNWLFLLFFKIFFFIIYFFTNFKMVYLFI